MKILIPARIVEVPDGIRCASWNPKEKGFSCPFFKDEYNGDIRFHHCKLFDRLIFEYVFGDGAYKIEECLTHEAVND